MHRSIRIALAASFLGLSVLPQDASAERKADGRFKDWAVYTEVRDGDLVCYAATPAEDKAPRDFEHGEVHFYVGVWKSRPSREQPSLRVGFDLRPDLAPNASVSRQKWTLFSAGREAFALDEDDSEIVSALRRGSELRIEATSNSGTPVTYHFSLSGSSAAIDRATALCR